MRTILLHQECCSHRAITAEAVAIRRHSSPELVRIATGVSKHHGKDLK